MQNKNPLFTEKPILVFTGLPASGKSFLAQQFMKSFQKHEVDVIGGSMKEIKWYFSKHNPYSRLLYVSGFAGQIDFDTLYNLYTSADYVAKNHLPMNRPQIIISTQSQQVIPEYMKGVIFQFMFSRHPVSSINH